MPKQEWAKNARKLTQHLHFENPFFVDHVASQLMTALYYSVEQTSAVQHHSTIAHYTLVVVM